MNERAGWSCCSDRPFLCPYKSPPDCQLASFLSLLLSLSGFPTPRRGKGFPRAGTSLPAPFSARTPVLLPQPFRHLADATEVPAPGRGPSVQQEDGYRISSAGTAASKRVVVTGASAVRGPLLKLKSRRLCLGVTCHARNPDARLPSRQSAARDARVAELYLELVS